MVWNNYDRTTGLQALSECRWHRTDREAPPRVADCFGNYSQAHSVINIILNSFHTYECAYAARLQLTGQTAVCTN